MFVLILCVGFNSFINFGLYRINSFVNAFRTRHLSFIQVVAYVNSGDKYARIEKNFLILYNKTTKAYPKRKCKFKTDRGTIHEIVKKLWQS